MGNDCSNEERKIRYMAFQEALITIDKEIKKELSNPYTNAKKYNSYGLINKEICTKYPFLLNEKFDTTLSNYPIFNYKDLIKEMEDKDFTYIDKKFGFRFPTDFIFVNKDFMDVICSYLDERIRNKLKTPCEYIIGGGCLIKKNSGDQIRESFRYITLYNELKEAEGNCIDFFIFIIDKEKRDSAENYILKNNIWKYFEKIKYNYKEEYKKIIDDDSQDIGYIVRNSPILRIESHLSKMKKQEKINTNLPKKIINPIQNQNNQQMNFKNQDLPIKNSINNSFNNNSNNNIFNNININGINNQNIPFNMNNMNNMNNNFQNFPIQMNMNDMNMINNNINNMNLNFNGMNQNNNIQNNMMNWNNNNINMNNISNMNNINNIQNLYNQINYLNNEVNNLKQVIQKKEDENKELKQRLDNLINNKTNLVDFNKIQVIQFISMDHSVICGIKCLLSDTFAEVEEKLYKIYPEYRETNNVFQVDGRPVLRFKTVSENNIQIGHPVQLIKIE